jgi:hypothetical protein
MGSPWKLSVRAGGRRDALGAPGIRAASGGPLRLCIASRPRPDRGNRMPRRMPGKPTGRLSEPGQRTERIVGRPFPANQEPIPGTARRGADGPRLRRVAGGGPEPQCSSQRGRDPSGGEEPEKAAPLFRGNRRAGAARRRAPPGLPRATEGPDRARAMRERAGSTRNGPKEKAAEIGRPEPCARRKPGTARQNPDRPVVRCAVSFYEFCSTKSTINYLIKRINRNKHGFYDPAALPMSGSDLAPSPSPRRSHCTAVAPGLFSRAAGARVPRRRPRIEHTRS